jgi:hypothetical protein
MTQEPPVPHSIRALLPGIVETLPQPPTEVSSDFPASGNDERVSMVCRTDDVDEERPNAGSNEQGVLLSLPLAPTDSSLPKFDFTPH